MEIRESLALKLKMRLQSDIEKWVQYFHSLAVSSMPDCSHIATLVELLLVCPIFPSNNLLILTPFTHVCQLHSVTYLNLTSKKLSSEKRLEVTNRARKLGTIGLGL